ncbi:hypothetical protein ACIGZJ_17600 [Kitasatospora sp. NPDC052868]|uniref:hypothetical protein n=1 Tax=Kitasatospora sp. NPDC052868 TaxID=3364060 RepID=UPI0037CB28E9
MPSLLHYDIVTDPTSLQASQYGAPSVGAVYVVVSNAGTDPVGLHALEVKVPVGDGPGDLTPHPERVERGFEIYPQFPNPPITFDWDGAKGAFQLTLQPRMSLNVDPGDSIVLKLENITVAAAAGLALLKIHEKAHPFRKPKADESRVVTLGLLKNVPKVPRNFRPARTRLDVDAGEQVKLEWNGPSNLDYWIRFPDGTSEHVAQAGPGPSVVDQPYTWPAPGATPVPAPKRGTTYTLIAGTNVGGQAQHGYFLTTTVHALVPEFESGTRTPWIEGASDRGRVTFTPDGVTVDDRNQALGTVTAATADVQDVRTGSVKGRTPASGWIDFPDSGVDVFHGPNRDLGVVTADRLDVLGVNTKWVGDRNSASGWLEFPQSGINVRKDGGQEWGTVAADKADLNGVNTRWVQGRTADDGWIEFPAAGLNVFQGAGDRQWGTVAADKADLNDLVTRRAQVEERLTLNGGLTVHGVSELEGRVNAKGDLHVDGDSVFLGKVNANGCLSVRNKGQQLMHVNDGMVAIQGDLRVHGALRADS